MRGAPRGGGGFGGGGGYQGGGGRGGFGGDDGRPAKVQSDNQIFVQGMPTDVSDDDVAQFFGSIGTIKTDRKTGKLRIFLYTDRNTGAPKGEGTVTYRVEDNVLDVRRNGTITVAGSNGLNSTAVHFVTQSPAQCHAGPEESC